MGFGKNKAGVERWGIGSKVLVPFSKQELVTFSRKCRGRWHELLSFALFFLLSVSVFGQFSFEELNNSKGLSQGYVTRIHQDTDGFLWIGTKDGLNRYDGYHFKVFTHDAYDSTSISSNAVNNLFEDSKGRLWVSTDDGVINVYDKLRNKFHRISHDPNRTGGLTADAGSTSIVECPDGRFLVPLLLSGINLVELPTGFFEKGLPAIVTPISTPFSGMIQHLVRDAKQRIWMISNEKLYEYQYQSRQVIMHKDGSAYTCHNTKVDGATWTKDIFFSLFDGSSRFPVFDQEIAYGHATSYFRDQKDRLWVGITNLNKLLIYDLKSWKKGDQTLHAQDQLIYEDNAVTPNQTMLDQSGTLWLGTNGYGLRKYSFESEKFNHSAVGRSIRKIIIGSQNDLYVKDWADCKRTNKTGKNIPMDPALSLSQVYDLFGAKNGDLWTTKIQANPQRAAIKVLERYNPITRNRQSYALDFEIMYATLGPWLEDHLGNIWIGGINGNYLVFNPTTGHYKVNNINTDLAHPMQPNATMTTFYEDAEHYVWIGTVEGFVRVQLSGPDKDQMSCTWIKSIPNDKTSLNSNSISCFLDDPFDKNLLWVCTKGGGLNRMDKRTGKFVHLTTKEGLCNNVVYGILTDDGGNIWGSTNQGLFCLLAHGDRRHEPWEFRHFTKAAGLQSDEFNTGAFAKLPNGDLAFGGVNGLNIFNPKAILVDKFIPNIFITNLLVQNKSVAPDDASGILQQAIEYAKSITLKHTQDLLTLEFAALDFRAPDQNKYRYQMVGIDPNWIESGSRRNVTYSHLPAGTYTFRVQGSNSLGIWGDKYTELKVTVLPPWWATWWAYLGYILILGLTIRAYLRYRVEQAKMESQLSFEQQEAKRIKELDTVKTQLYTNITHEFRTPLTVILGMAQQVKNAPKEQLETGLDMIIRNGKNLLNLVNEMLDLSKLEAGKMQLNLTEGDVVQFLRYIVESFHSMAESQGIQMHYLASLDALYTRYDAEKMRQIVANLLSNALKFTAAKGNIYVSISSSETDEAAQKHALVIRIKDTGTGIPEAQIPHIFDRFYQIDNSHTRKAEGTGIGLALTKELVQLMGGTIEVKSPPIGAKKGTEFTVTLPLEILEEDLLPQPVKEDWKTQTGSSSSTQSAPPALITTQSNSDSQLILLVEDNADVVAYIASCLPEYRLAVGKDGQEGLDIACDLIPDLIITDVMMPLLDGFEMCSRLRKDERTNHIPIIMLTAKADMASKLEGIDRGVDAYLEKPFHKEELLLRIKKLLELRRELQLYYRQQFTTAALPSSTETVVPEPTVLPTEHAFVQKIRVLVEENLTDVDYSVDQLCKDLYMSHSQLHRKLDALVGIAPSRFIRVLRMNKAKALLLDPAVSISKIAFDCGYTAPGYFTRVFKQEFGVTPQEWRQQQNV